jgi:aspartate/tyrosine/aromatic aminotransferase
MAAAAPSAARAGVFAAAPQLPPAVIFHLGTRFRADPHPRKLNLGVGAYRDEQLRPVVFAAVRAAEQAVVAAGGDKEYLPIAGLAEFRAAAARLLFGEGCAALAEGRVASAQTLSGTGSLAVAAHLLKRLLPGRRIFCSDPTWENHGKLVADCGAGMLEYYRYYDAATRGLDLAGLLADLEAMPEGSVVLLHAVAHNPTGVDPSRAQWAAVAEVVQRRRLFPWFDIAYQGFASGDPEEDAWAVRDFAARGVEMIVSQSFAKNFGLYCERVGALHVLCADKASAAAVLSNVEAIVRPMYSNPPAHGARIVARVLSDAALTASWKAELLEAMHRVQRMRRLLRAALEARATPGSWAHVTDQVGMFSYTGLSVAQSTRMVEEFHVYMLTSGRINVAGLNEATVPILADAIHAVVTGAPAPPPPA